MEGVCLHGSKYRKMNHVIVYSRQLSPRLSYILNEILKDRLKLSYLIVNEVGPYLQSNLPKINYSLTRLCPEEIHIPSSLLLFEKGTLSQKLHLGKFDGLPTLFSFDLPDADLPFDLFAMAFYLLSRYEEYLPFQGDRHGRFPASESIALKAKFLKLPMVDKWVQRFQKILREKHPELPSINPKMLVLPTVDVDQAWAYLNYPFWRRWLSGSKNLLRGNRSKIQEQRAVLKGLQADPFFQFEWLEAVHRKFNLTANYFFLVGKFGRYDKNPSSSHPAFKELLSQLKKKNSLGWHPSYRSNLQPRQLALEKERLEQSLGKEIDKSRQHYLKMELPETYQRLLQLGVRHDYTMGYADAIGFRASTCFPFRWYDLEREESTDLTLHPFLLMDVTLKNYLGLDKEAAMAEALTLLNEVRRVGGTFCILWHNSSLTENGQWEGWKAWYHDLLEKSVGESE